MLRIHLQSTYVQLSIFHVLLEVFKPPHKGRKYSFMTEFNLYQLRGAHKLTNLHRAPYPFVNPTHIFVGIAALNTNNS